MASTIITKNSSTASAVPVVGDLTKGELAVNVTDKKIYTKDNSAAIVKLVGSLGNQEASAVAITGGSIAGITDLAVADGGTGSSTAAGARSNLSAAASGANSDITSLSGLTTALSVAQGGTGVTSSTGSGSVVLSNSPTLVTPALGTPSAAVLTNATGLPLSTGISGLGTGVATFLGTPSSANLLAAVTDETGTGALVFANSPTLVTPALGTPSALVGTNITGTASGLTAGNVTTNANLTGAVTSVGNATSLGSFSSANLLAALTDETGTGSAVFATSPTLVTPILGTPTSATLTNATGLPLTTGVTGTLPVANGGTGTASPSIVAGTNVTVTGTWPNQTINSTASGTGDVVGPASSTDNAFARFDSTTGKLLQNSTGATLSDTGAATFTGALDVLGNSTAGSNIKLYEDTDNGTNYVAFKAPDTIAANVTWTLPSADGTNTQVLQTNGSGVLSFATAGSSQWTTTGSDIYYNTGNVGIGTTTPTDSGGFGRAVDAQSSGGAAYYAKSATSGTYGGVGHVSTSGGTTYVLNSGTGPTLFTVNGAIRARILATGGIQSANSISVGDATPTSSGAGITFPATQSASSDANTLDDYEEGTWTPTSPNNGYVFSTVSGKYTKIGNVVYIGFTVVFSTIGTSNSAVVFQGLPFTKATAGTGACREGSTTGAIYMVASSGATFVELNSMDGVANGTNRTIRTSEEYICSYFYYV